jgi:hypothetical protein
MERGTVVMAFVPIAAGVLRILLSRRPRPQPNGREQTEAEHDGNGSQPVPVGLAMKESVSHEFSFT